MNQRSQTFCQKQKEVKAKKQEALRNKLLPRVFQYKLIKDDKKSSQQTVIVHPTHNVLGFRTNCYVQNQQYLEKYICQEQFDDTVRMVNNIIETKVIKHRKDQNSDIFIQASRLFKVSVVFAAVGLIILGATVYFEMFQKPISNEQRIARYFGACLLVASSVCAIAGVVSIQLKKFVKFNKQLDISTELRKYLNQKNLQLVSSNRPFLKWEVDQRFFWLTLNISLEEIPDDFECLSENS